MKQLLVKAVGPLGKPWAIIYDDGSIVPDTTAYVHKSDAECALRALQHVPEEAV